MDTLPPDPWSLFFAIIISGGIVAGIFEGIRNWFAKKREEYIDISKTKMEKISNALPYYNKFVYYFLTIGNYINHVSKENNPDFLHQKYSKEYLYYIGILLNLLDNFNKEFGALQLDSIAAENILSNIIPEYQKTIRRKIGFNYFSILSSDLVRRDNDYFNFHEFDSKFMENHNFISSVYDDLRVEFENKILSDENTMDKLYELGSCFVDILVFEVNHSFKLWYGQGQKYENLKPTTLRYIILNSPKYYKRITNLSNRKLLEPLSWIR